MGPATLSDVVAASAAVASTRSRLRKTEILADVLTRLPDDERAMGVAYLSGRPVQEKLGVGWSAISSATAEPVDVPTLSLAEVHGVLDAIAASSGPGSVADRRRLLESLLGRATDDEQDFLRRLILRDLRQGSTEGLMVDAIAAAAGVPADVVRRAAMVTGDLVTTGSAALSGAIDELNGARLALLRPLQPMLAQTAEDIAEAMAPLGRVAVEAKLDGARLQVHRLDGSVRVFTRNLRDVTDRVPEVVETITALPHDSLILDGEVIALDDGGRPFPFQVTMGRFGRRLDVPRSRRSLPVTPFFFDVLHMDGVDLIDRPAEERLSHLDLLPGDLLVPRVVTDDPGEAQQFLEKTLAAGHEGVVVKDLAAPYAAGRRGAAWRKVKPSHTLDLVVLAVEWGSGRREGWLSNLHLGARDPDGGFVMLGKTFKGLTDEMLTWQTERLLELEVRRDRNVVHVRPELVVEVAFDGVQASTRYPGGVALRFARVKGYRPDRDPGDADTIETIRAMRGR